MTRQQTLAALLVALLGTAVNIARADDVCSAAEYQASNAKLARAKAAESQGNLEEALRLANASDYCVDDDGRPAPSGHQRELQARPGRRSGRQSRVGIRLLPRRYARRAVPESETGRPARKRETGHARDGGKVAVGPPDCARRSRVHEQGESERRRGVHRQAHGYPGAAPAGGGRESVFDQFPSQGTAGRSRSLAAGAAADGCAGIDRDDCCPAHCALGRSR